MADGCACCGGASAARLLILYCRPEHARVNRMSSPRPALACSGPSGFQPKGNLSFTFTSLDSSGQAAQAASGHECWLESVAAVSTASYSPCTTPITLRADIQVRGCFHGWASMCAAGRSFLRFATTALISLPMRVLPCLPLLLQDGQYRFHARAVGSGATPGAEAVSVFTVDSVAPVVTIKGACVYLSGAGQGWASVCHSCRWLTARVSRLLVAPLHHCCPWPRRCCRGPRGGTQFQLDCCGLCLQRGGLQLLLRVSRQAGS
jgi:hypothetical protein